MFESFKITKPKLWYSLFHLIKYMHTKITSSFFLKKKKKGKELEYFFSNFLKIELWIKHSVRLQIYTSSCPFLFFASQVSEEGKCEVCGPQ